MGDARIERGGLRDDVGDEVGELGAQRGVFGAVCLEPLLVIVRRQPGQVLRYPRDTHHVLRIKIIQIDLNGAMLARVGKLVQKRRRPLLA